jgi:hypothetical protein
MGSILTHGFVQNAALYDHFEVLAVVLKHLEVTKQ